MFFSKSDFCLIQISVSILLMDSLLVSLMRRIYSNGALPLSDLLILSSKQLSSFFAFFRFLATFFFLILDSCGTVFFFVFLHSFRIRWFICNCCYLRLNIVDHIIVWFSYSLFVCIGIFFYSWFRFVLIYSSDSEISNWCQWDCIGKDEITLICNALYMIVTKDFACCAYGLKLGVKMQWRRIL